MVWTFQSTFSGSCLGVVTETLHIFYITENNWVNLEENKLATVFLELIWIYYTAFSLLIVSTFANSHDLRYR